MYQHRRKPKPKLKLNLEPGQQFEATVRDLTSDGRGVIAHPNGRVFFVPGVWVDEHALFEISALKGRTGSARLIELLNPSPNRVISECPYHGFDKVHCGGCGWMFMSYAKQLDAKQARVQRAIENIFEGVDVEPILGSPKEREYRNRAQLKTDGKRLGYMASGSHSIVDISNCVVLNNHNQQILRTLRQRLPVADWRPKRDDWTSLHIDDDLDAPEVQTNTKRPFRQGNSEQNLVMRDWVRDQLRPRSSNSAILELFAGSGNFTEVLHNEGWSRIFAIDSFLPAVEALKERSLSGVEAHCINLDQLEITSQLSPQMAEVEALLLDPPRQGMKNLKQVLRFAPRLNSVVYVSCDVATFARDSSVLKEAKFSPKLVQALDLFPQTPHVEVMSLFTRDS